MDVKPKTRDEGFLLIELLFASVLLAFVLLGITGLFTRAMVDNHLGHESSVATGEARAGLEGYLALPIDAPELTLPAGELSLRREEYLVVGRGWQPSPGPGQTTLWRRTTTVTQHRLGALDEQLRGGTPAADVHVKRIEVAVEGLRGTGPLPPPRRVTLVRYRGI